MEVTEIFEGQNYDSAALATKIQTKEEGRAKLAKQLGQLPETPDRNPQGFILLGPQEGLNLEGKTVEVDWDQTIVSGILLYKKEEKNNLFLRRVSVFEIEI